MLRKGAAHRGMQYVSGMFDNISNMTRRAFTVSEAVNMSVLLCLCMLNIGVVEKDF